MGILDSIGTYLGDEENRLNLAHGFAGMSGNPNAGNIQRGFQDRLSSLRDDRKLKTANELATSKLNRQSEMAMKILGDKFPMLSQALKAGLITPNDAFLASRKGLDVKVVGSSLVDSSGKVLYDANAGKGNDTTAFQTLKARAAAAGFKEGTPEYQQFMVQGGANRGMTFSSDGKGGITMTQGGATIPKLTETQGKATGFYQRANSSNKIITDLEDTGTDLGQFILGQIPLTNFARSPEYQMLDSAKRDWISAVLRLESGAAIGKDEFTNYDLAYFPQVGDSPEVLAQKRRSRLIHENSLKTQAGTGITSGAKAGGSTVLTYNPVTGELE